MLKLITLSFFFFIILLNFSLCQDSALCRRPQVAFCSGFEEGSKAIWDDNDQNPDTENQIIQHPGPFNIPGNHVMRFRVPPGRGGSDLIKVLSGSYDRLFLRWYQMWEPGYDFTAPNHGSGLYGGSRNMLGASDNRPDGTNFFISTFEPLENKPNLYAYYRGMYMDCANPVGQCWGDHFPCWFDEGQRICTKPQHREKIMPPQLEAGRWYCFEIFLDAGTPVNDDSLADGILNYWIDGIEYGPWAGLWFRTTPNLKLTILWLMLFHHQAHSVEGILLDNIVVSTERIGTANVNYINNVLTKEKSLDFDIISDFPNNNITLNIRSTTNQKIIINIINILGETVLTEEVNNSSENFFEDINIKNLSKGIYLVSLKTTKDIMVKKLLLNENMK